MRNRIKGVSLNTPTLLSSGLDLPPVPGSEQNKNRAHVMLMKDTFTWDENMQIAFVPLIIVEMAQFYIDRVLKYCADNKMDTYRRHSRAVKRNREEYLRFIGRDLSKFCMDRLSTQTRTFIDECEIELTKLWFSVNNDILRVLPGDKHVKMRTDAALAIIMFKFLYEHNDRMDKLISKRLEPSKTVTNPLILKMKRYMYPYYGQVDLDFNTHVKVFMGILKNNVHKIEFYLVGEK